MTKEQRTRYLIALAIAGLCGFMGFQIVGAYKVLLDYPTVYFSYKTKQCVDVQDWKDNPIGIRPAYSCENLPKKFNHEWVE